MCIEEERRRRIKVALWAYAYELKDDPLVSDHQFDMTCLKIDPSIKTDNELLDIFFSTIFNTHTGSWVHNHPELDKLEALYYRVGHLYKEKQLCLLLS